MKKLALNLDELQVEGFETAATSAWIEITVPGGDVDAATTPCTEKRSCGHICP